MMSADNLDSARFEALVDKERQAPASPFGFRFDYTPPPSGYAWWYIDGISEDGAHAIVIIIFVGSVFSPYYAWSSWRDPANHCAVNVALYGRPQRWSMTERPSHNVERTAQVYSTGSSHVRRTDAGLSLEFDEVCAPLPRRMRGTVRVTMPYQNTEPFQIDAQGRHFWSPACAHAHLSVDFEQPGLSWQGHGYVDSNYGLEPVTQGFDYWDWSRTPSKGGDTLIRYVTDPVAAAQRDLNIRIPANGRIETDDPKPSVDLSPTSIWRIKRRGGMLANRPPRIVKTLEDTPFYSRSILEYADGAAGLTTHETLSCRRLRSPIVKSLLPFRMPRLSH